MAGNVLDFIGSASIGTQAYDITKSTTDSFTAGGFAAFVQSVTGEIPFIYDLGNKKARIVLSKNQVVKMQKYLDTQLGKALNFKMPASNLDIALNPVVIPWALKYIIPASLLLILTGWVAHWYMSR